jgi:hypothetical protein
MKPPAPVTNAHGFNAFDICRLLHCRLAIHTSHRADVTADGGVLKRQEEVARSLRGETNRIHGNARERMLTFLERDTHAADRTSCVQPGGGMFGEDVLDLRGLVRFPAGKLTRWNLVPALR